MCLTTRSGADPQYDADASQIQLSELPSDALVERWLSNQQASSSAAGGAGGAGDAAATVMEALEAAHGAREVSMALAVCPGHHTYRLNLYLCVPFVGLHCYELQPPLLGRGRRLLAITSRMACDPRPSSRPPPLP